ncbi:MAG TPA: phospholipase D-like domain-containing protein [Xanthomonadaceae bacterium]|nr:phospholipase D-like domain-containing protein [Xanthomonadaceae bacterium]
MALPLCGCAGLRPHDLDHAETLAAVARPTALDCDRADACAQTSPLYALGDRAMSESTADKPVNYVQIVESGQDSLQGRINLIRSARSTIDLQTFIFSHDDSGYLFLNELLAAARRGVRVRLLVDQLFGPSDPDLLAVLAAAHANFQMRLYNPTFGRARTSPLQYAGAIVFRFRSFNQRMHIKQMIVDGRVGITGGRNIDDRYFDWSPELDFRDRDAILAGPGVAEMERVFGQYWDSERSVPVARLKDVASELLANHGPPPGEPIADEHRTPRVLAMAKAASDQDDIAAKLVATARPVEFAQFVADGPGKHDRLPVEGGRATRNLRQLIESAQSSVVLQTPYLLLTNGASEMFRAMHKRPDPPQVTISTNSLASTDAIPAFSLSYKYSRRYLHELGFHIFELKPYPADVPVDLGATGAYDSITGALATGTDSGSRLRVASESVRFPGLGSASSPAPLRDSGLRISLHAKSMVVDGQIGMIGSHNFDPRSDNYNTEGVLVFRDTVLAKRLQDAIEADTAPQNSWLVARRPHSPVSHFTGKADGVFENLPLFDVWPFRYSTSYELVPGCAPVPPKDPKFQACWTPVGDFPEVEISFRAIAVRVMTAFGAGLAPIL